MQSYAQQKSAVSEASVFAYKQHILSRSAGFASAPEEDLFRVNLLGRMLDRHDELAAKGMSELSCRSRVLHEYADVAGLMRGQGFAESAEHEPASRWPALSEADAERYIRERDAYMHKTALGVFMCVACLMPMMMLCALEELLFGYNGDMLALVGLVGMFAMIGMGVYTIVTAEKPKDENRVKKGRFSLGRSLRARLEAMKDPAAAKARKRIGRGVATIVMSIIPVLIGAAIGEGAYTDAGPLFGVAGMFAMIGKGVYEFVMSGAEKKTISLLLGKTDE